MSVKTWMAEFYPKSVDKIKTVKGALKASIHKYKGTRKVNLDKHHVFLSDNVVIDSFGNDLNCFEFNTATCSLCHIFKHCCMHCVLSPINTCTNSWRHFSINKDPEPMIKDLRAALKCIDKKR